MSVVRLPEAALPDDAPDRGRVLAEYFAFERPATASLVNGRWELEVGGLADPACWVDERLAEGLSWLGASSDLAAMGEFVQGENGFVLALNDAWGLWSAARWLRHSGATGSVVILHADDHRDLSPPRLAVEGDGYIDLITGAPVALDQPEQIADAIRSGAIGMGSFLTPLVWGLGDVEFRHLRVGASSGSMGIQCLTEADSLLRPNAPRPAVELCPESPQSGSRYVTTSSPQKWVRTESSGPILVHLDLDYLNNRYDADSDWSDREGRHDPSPAAALRLLDDLLDGLAQPEVAARIADIFVGISPGFFPAEHWPAAIETCRRRLPQLRVAG